MPLDKNFHFGAGTTAVGILAMNGAFHAESLFSAFCLILSGFMLFHTGLDIVRWSIK